MNSLENGTIFFCVCFCPFQVCSKLSPELSELVVYCRSVPFRGFENVSEKPPNEMSSFSENDALRLIKDSGTTVEMIASTHDRKSKRFCDAAADSTANIISLQCIIACGLLSFHMQGSFL